MWRRHCWRVRIVRPWRIDVSRSSFIKDTSSPNGVLSLSHGNGPHICNSPNAASETAMSIARVKKQTERWAWIGKREGASAAEGNERTGAGRGSVVHTCGFLTSFVAAWFFSLQRTLIALLDFETAVGHKIISIECFRYRCYD